jgi:flagellar hook-basal body complex protein FliE
MNPVGISGGIYQSPYAALRPDIGRKPLGDAAREIGTIGDSPTIQPGQIGQAPQFENVLGNFVKEVNSKQAAAADKVTGLLSGQNVPLHQAMVSMEEASVSFQLMVEVRNKLLEGYQELMRLQV